MSRKRKEHYTCPKCGQENEFTMWQSLNGDLDPEAKRQLLDGSLFLARCGHCGFEAQIDYPLLYHDMRHQAMVQLVDAEGVERAREVLLQSLRMFESSLEIHLPPTRMRIVTEPNALREKAIIFENGLDDRVVELIKAIYFAGAIEQFPDAHIRNVYFMVDEQGYSLQFLADEPLSAKIPPELYEELAQKYAGRLDAAGDDECAIDLHWAARFLHG